MVSDPVVLPVPGPLGLVGFDAADVVRGALHQSLDEAVGLFLKGGREQCYLVLPVKLDPRVWAENLQGHHCINHYNYFICQG